MFYTDKVLNLYYYSFHFKSFSTGFLPSYVAGKQHKAEYDTILDLNRNVTIKFNNYNKE